MANNYIQSITNGGGSSTNTTSLASETTTTNTYGTEDTVKNPSIISTSSFGDKVKQTGLSSIDDFKEASDYIYENRKEVKIQMDELTKNVYSTLNQINFSIKLVLDTNNFLSKYTNGEDELVNTIEEALTDTTASDNDYNSLDLFNNLTFNNLYISNVLFFENFSKVLMEAISFYLIENEGNAFNDTTEDIFSFYCNSLNLKNNWEKFFTMYNTFTNTYKDIMSIESTVLEENRTNNQSIIFKDYQEYIKPYNYIQTIFSNNTWSLEDIEETLIPAIRGIINFKSNSTLYSKQLDKLDTVLTETGDLFTRIIRYASTLITHNKQYQSSFENDNTYLEVIISVSNIAVELLSALRLKYPNRNTRQGLISDSNFTKVLTIIDNLYRKEISAVYNLISLVSKDYKLIKSLETFITEEKSFDNSVLFDIMSDFDNELKGIVINERRDVTLSSLVRLFFGGNSDKETGFNNDSFTSLLFSSTLLTEPLYDILSYYRLFFFSFTKDVSLIFDWIETLYIFNKKVTNDPLPEMMENMFEIKTKNIDYIHINESKINESITSRFTGLDDLNYFNIEAFIDIIKVLDLEVDITSVDDLVTWFNTNDSVNDNKKNYNLMIFSIIENILYNDIDLDLVMSTLSLKSNFRTLFFKIMFGLAIDKLINNINTYYSNDIPIKVSIYPSLVKNSIKRVENLIDDLKYIQTLISANEYYFGKDDSFNIDVITNWEGANIWLEPENIRQLFSLYKEV